VSSNAFRALLNRRDLHRRLVGWFAAGAVPFALAGGLLLAHAPLEPLKHLLGIFLIGVVAWRRLGARPRRPAERTFAAVGAASGLGSALLGSVGPLTAPFFLAYGLTRGAYIGTEAAAALTMHLSKIAAYGAGDLLSGRVLAFGVALTPATLAGAWLGRRIVGRMPDAAFVAVVEIGLVVAGVLFLIGP
jgi:uncharacterized membrane protein YfcA